MLLARLHPIEAWDLLYILAQGSDAVLGNEFSRWRKEPARAIRLVTGQEQFQGNFWDFWEWVRNPLPPSSESTDFMVIRSDLEVSEDKFVVQPQFIDKLSELAKARLERIKDDFFASHNPFIRHIVRRTRGLLEKSINPETGEPYLKRIEVELFGEGEDEAIELPPYLKEAYGYAERFCQSLRDRVKSSSFLKTMLLRRVGSTIIAGKNTAERMLSKWGPAYILEDEEEEDIEFADEEILEERDFSSQIKELTGDKVEYLRRFISLLEANEEEDPKYNLVLKILTDSELNFIERGCIIFSQYYDSSRWIAEKLLRDLKSEKIGLYAGGEKSGIFVDGVFERVEREDLKEMVKKREIRVLVGKDAASEGLNLQTLGSLINLDLPWNPTRLEQRKGRIQRIGQLYDKVYIYNMRYKDSVEDRVHSLLSERLRAIYNMFGQIPDILEDVWVHVALNEIEEAKKKIDAVPKQHPFQIRYHEKLSAIPWESCARILDNRERKRHLLNGW